MVFSSFNPNTTVHDIFLNRTPMTRIGRIVADSASTRSAQIRCIRVICVLFRPLSIFFVYYDHQLIPITI